jgi:hypothetical protein
MVRREINPEVRIQDEKAGIVQYVASDQSIDAQNEVVRADGWRFDRFARNSPLVDSHRYGSVECVLGKVIDFSVQGRQLVETAQWAIDVPENTMAKLGFAMTKAGYLKAVSVGFMPEFIVTQVPQDMWGEDWGGAGILAAQSRQGKEIWRQQMQELGFSGNKQPQTVYMTQQQIELSACVIGANPNALAKSYKAGVLSDADLELISTERSKRETAGMALESAAAMQARQRKRKAFLDVLEKTIKGL